MHRLLAKQLQRSVRPDGARDWDQVCDLVDRTYTQHDQDRSRSGRATRLMLAELDEVNRLREETLGRLRREHEKLDAALGNMEQALAMFDAAGQLLVCNARYRELFALDDVQPGMAHADLAATIATRITPDGEQMGWASPCHGAAQRKTLELSFADGRTVSASFSPLRSGGWIEVYADITEQKEAAERIRYLAGHDALTGLPNRRVFNEAIARECERVRRGASAAVLCLDLDHFKGVNDTLGHPIGDQLLKEVAERVRRTLRTIDTVARLGGDEFAIIQCDLQQPDNASRLARRIIEAVSKPYVIDGHHIVIGTSVGIAISPGDGADADHLIRNADMALYRAKADGRGTFRFFEAGMDVAIQARRKLELDLRFALKCGQFELNYQPLYNLGAGTISCCEALIRWNHPTAGRIAPDQFIPLAEEIGLMVEIGEWVLEEACKTACAWPEEIGIAVNVSPVQFKSSLVDSVRRALQRSGLSPRRLELEITESVLLQDTERTLGLLHELRALGVRIAMDDFGTGYSSLSYLRKFPFDKLKIDRSFVRDLNEASEATAIVRAVTDLATSLGMQTTAEGVETADQRRTLEALKCTEIQGYLISRPLAVADIAALVAAGAPAQRAA
jgi:diguanylate cyclase (GGDEF)-like protein